MKAQTTIGTRGVVAWLAIGAISLWCVAAAGAANIANGNVNSGGQTNACAGNTQSSVDPSAGLQGLQIGSGSCRATTGSTAGADTGQPASGSSGDSSTTSTQTSSSSTSTTGTSSSRVTASSSSKKASLVTVLAERAAGIRIAHVRFAAGGGRLRVVVALRDEHGHPIRAAAVSISGIAGAKSTVSHPFLQFSGRLGNAAFSLPITAHMHGKRLLVRITARTPHARTWTLGSKLVMSRG